MFFFVIGEAQMANYVGNVAEAAMNCFSFDPYRGVAEGIVVTENMLNPRNDGSVYPPHIRCDGFINLDRVKAPTTKTVGEQRLLTQACLRQIDPTNGGKSFNMFSSIGRTGILLLINLLATSHRVKEKVSGLRAWEGIEADNDIEKLLVSPSGALLFLTEDGQEVDVYLHNGSVFRLRREKDSVVNIPLTWTDMAKMRVEQFRTQIATLGDDEDDVRRLHGVLGGAIRLVRFCGKEQGPREVVSEFLAENVGNMTDRIRTEVRALLLLANDKYAGIFITGHNIVSLDDRRRNSGDAGRKLAEAKKKKAERQQRDRDAYLAKHVGGNQKKGKQVKGE